MLATDTLFYSAKDKERVYYKEMYSEWTQPVFNANNFNHVSGNFILTASHQANPAWYAFNASNTGNNCWWTNHGTTTETNSCWICFYSTKKMKFNSIQIKNETETPVNFKTGVLQGSQDGQTWVDLCALTGQNTTALEMTFDFENDTGYYYYRCYFTEAFGAGVAIQWIKFYGTQHTNTTVSTATDYDYYEDVPELKSLKLETAEALHYFKYKYIPWNKAGHPYLSSNTSDPQFKVSASSIYSSEFQVFYSFKNSSGANPWFAADSDTNPWYRIDLDRPIRITRVDMRNRSSQHGTGADKPYIFQARNYDTEEWVDLTPKTTAVSAGQGATWSFYPAALKGYRQYRWLFEAKGGVSIGFPTFVWEEEVPVTCVESDKYDGYTIIPSELYTTGVTYPEKKYYKRGLEPNILRLDTAGTAVIENGIITNVNAASRLCLPKAPVNVKSYEIQIKFKTVAFNDGRLIGNYKTNVRSPQIELPADITQDAATALWFGHPGASDAWTGLTLITKLEFDTDYWVRAIWTGTATQLWLSTDGINFNLEGSNTSTACYWTEQFLFGVDVDAYAIDPNTRIDLKESYIKINNEIWWRGTFPEECSEEEAEWSELVNIGKPIN